MTELLLIGASGLAREVLNVLRAGADTRTVGVLDDLPELWGESIDGAAVLGGLDEVVRHPDAQLILCVGQGGARARIAERLARLGATDARFARVIHPGVEVPGNCLIGAGSVVLAGVVFTADVVLGQHVVVMPHVTLTHGNRVESFATLCAGVTLGGDVRIGNGAYVGMNASVRQRVRVGAGAVLGMGAALLDDMPPDETWVGVPARLRAVVAVS
jgi:sugar O-acyltransferase (sialic acid O-acetyltransferase NeuD family)